MVSGQTYTFRINNTAGFTHDFYLGPPDKLQAGDVTGPARRAGKRERRTGVHLDRRASATGWQFGCTVPGHFQTMNGTLTLGGPVSGTRQPLEA